MSPLLPCRFLLRFILYCTLVAVWGGYVPVGLTIFFIYMQFVPLEQKIENAENAVIWTQLDVLYFFFTYALPKYRHLSTGESEGWMNVSMVSIRLGVGYIFIAQFDFGMGLRSPSFFVPLPNLHSAVLLSGNILPFMFWNCHVENEGKWKY